jgi:hypothetical protein
MPACPQLPLAATVRFVLRQEAWRDGAQPLAIDLPERVM